MYFGKKCMLSLRYYRPFEVLKGVGLVAYTLALPPSMFGVHQIFHVSMLKKYHKDDCIIRWDPKQFDKQLSYEEELNTIWNRDMRKLKTRVINFVKAQWRIHYIKEVTWEIEVDMHK